jgi:4-amino-4-deoxy-L-arabinose transferase-like glycosyltransferase
VRQQIQKLLQAWPLWAVLAAQTVLTVPWLWRTAPFTDEALYLTAGHLEWSHWLHHTTLPAYAFSGAPVLYPPLGALADSVGGLAAARGLSLALMLGATAMVYRAGSRLFGRWAALLASGLFAVSGLVVHYGAFATYDALALFFLTLGIWAAARVRDGGYCWIAGCAVALAVSNAAKYATLAWDPVVIGIVVLHGWDRGARSALIRGGTLALGAGALEAGLLAAAGPHYVRAVIITTVFRTVRWVTVSSSASVLWRAFAMTGVLVLPAALGPIVSAVRRNPPEFTCLLGLLVLAALIAPVDQAHIRQLSSLDKNVGFGLPFAVLAAGYAIVAGIDWLGERFAAGRIAGSVAAVALIILALVVGREQGVQFRGPSSTVAREIISAITHGYRRGTYIATDGAPWMEKYDVPQYYLPTIPAQAWLGIFDPSPVQRARFTTRICTGRISVVILRRFQDSYHHSYDYQIRKLMELSHRYRLAVAISQGNYATQVWGLTGAAGKASCM